MVFVPAQLRVGVQVEFCDQGHEDAPKHKHVDVQDVRQVNQHVWELELSACQVHASSCNLDPPKAHCKTRETNQSRHSCLSL